VTFEPNLNCGARNVGVAHMIFAPCSACAHEMHDSRCLIKMPEIGPIFYFRASARRRRCSMLSRFRIVFAVTLGIVEWAFANHCDR
jgi:hypothetical protein